MARSQGLPIAARIGRGECKVEGEVLTTKDVYACYGDTAWRNYEFSFRAMGHENDAKHDNDAKDAQPGDLRLAGEVHICAGFRARNRDDRYVLGLKGGSFNALYLERLGYMGTDDYLDRKSVV